MLQILIEVRDVKLGREGAQEQILCVRVCVYLCVCILPRERVVKTIYMYIYVFMYTYTYISNIYYYK